MSLRLLTALVFFFISNAVFGQIVQKNIDWGKNSECTGCSRIDSEYTYIVDIPMNEAFIYNGIVSVTEKEIITDPTELSYYSLIHANRGFKYTVLNRIIAQKPVLTLKFPAIYSENGQLYKVLKYTLEYSKTSQPVELRQNAGLKLRTSSILSSGNWYKFEIAQSGVYKLDYSFLTKDMKIPSSELNLSTIGIFGYGGGVLPEQNNANTIVDVPENNISVNDANNNGKLDDGEYILFYADGPFRWNLDQNNKYRHKSKYYTETQSFFISTTQGTKLALGNYQVSGTPTKTISLYDNFGTIDRDSMNPNLSGRIWMSDRLNVNNKSVTKILPILNLTAGQEVEVVISYFNKIPTSSYSVKINDVYVQSFNIGDSYFMKFDTVKFLANSSTASITIELNGSSNESFYLDYLEYNTKSFIRYNGSQFNFRVTEGKGTNNIYELAVASANNAKIWNVTQVSQYKNVPYSNNIFKIINNIPQEFVIFEDNNAYTPTAIGKIENQNLLNSPQVSNVIFTSKKWKDVATKIAQFHKEERNIESNVVDIEQVYNEFSSGNKDVMAIRKYLYMLYQNANGNTNLMPKTALMFGNACMDYKYKLGLSVDYIPTYQTLYPDNYLESFCTDDFYGLLDPTESTIEPTATMDIGIGRLTVTSLSEANDMYEKIKSYKSVASYSDWRNSTTLVSDDYDADHDNAFYIENEVMAKYIKSQNIKTNVEKIYLDAFKQTQYSGGQRYEDAEKLLKDKISFGSLLITYIGHGGFTNLAQERILSLSDIKIYKNLKNLPFITTATCGFAPYDKPSKERSTGEKFLLQKDGGAIGMFTTCREVLINDQSTFMDNFISQFYNRTPSGDFRSFGEISMNTKNANALNSNSQKVVLLGDPALILNMPKYNVVTTKIGVTGTDTLKALSKVTIEGEIRNLSNSFMSDFNGFCQVTIFDKASMGFLNYNDVKDPKIPNDTFSQQNSRIFKGSTNVENGKFKITFIVPKDINYAFGKGKISYYAADVNNKPYRDASGMDTNVLIGGANLSAASDNKPPIVNLFMNDEKFGFGGMTNADPILLAKLSDDNGINTTGAGIGHDITAILDGNQKLPIVLNNYYQSELNNYTLGAVKYPFYQLNEGKHTLKVKAWDVYNNPGEGYTEFIVSQGAKVALNHVLNYPNPFTSNTWFQFEHNRPGDLLDISINVMTISGKIIKRIHQKLSTDGFRVDKQIAWDGLDDYGNKIGRGVYVYFVTIRDSKGDNDTKYEKLVILQ